MAAASDKMGKRAQRKRENLGKNDDGSIFTTQQFGIAILVITLFCGFAILQFGILVRDSLNQTGGVVYIPLAEEDKLKTVFFSGDPYVLYCQGSKTAGGPVPQVVTEIAKAVQKDTAIGDTKFVTTDCFTSMTSGKSVSERFDFGKNEGFIGIFSNEDTPTMLNYLQSAAHVHKQLRPLLKPTLSKITYIKDWEKTQKRKTLLILESKSRSALTNMELVFQPMVKAFRRVKVVAVDTGFWKFDTSEEFEKLAPGNSDKDFGEAVCVTRIADEETGEPDPFAKTGEVKEAQKDEPKKPKYLANYLTNWEGDAPARFMEQCSSGGADDWPKLMRRPRVYARPSEPKVVRAPPRKGVAAAAEDEGLKKGGKEKVGRRADDGEDAAEDDMGDISDGAVEEETVEDVEDVEI